MIDAIISTIIMPILVKIKFGGMWSSLNITPSVWADVQMNNNLTQVQLSLHQIQINASDNHMYMVIWGSAFAMVAIIIVCLALFG